MPEGQYLGQKASYIYTTDNGTQFVLLRDTTLVFGELTGLELYTEGSTFAYSIPRKFRPRGVYWLGFSGQRAVRKYVICGTLDATLYASDTSQPLTIDGIAGFTTSRYGEQYQYIRKSAAIPVPQQVASKLVTFKNKDGQALRKSPTRDATRIHLVP